MKTCLWKVAALVWSRREFVMNLTPCGGHWGDRIRLISKKQTCDLGVWPTTTFLLREKHHWRLLRFDERPQPGNDISLRFWAFDPTGAYRRAQSVAYCYGRAGTPQLLCVCLKLIAPIRTIPDLGAVLKRVGPDCGEIARYSAPHSQNH